MDYLDPIKKRQHVRRIYLGYVLLAVVVFLMTVILVYMGSGFDVDRQTGTLIQNGQILAVSDPEGAEIYLDNKLQKPKTTGKLIVPSGSYGISVKKNGYRDWVQQVTVEGGRIHRLDYIKLLPQTIVTDAVQTLANAPTQVVQSPDKRYVAMVFADKPSSYLLYDLVRPEDPPATVTIPENVYSPAENSRLSIVEWAGDNKHILMQVFVNNASAGYLLVSRDSADTPQNLSVKYSLPADASVTLQNKSRDKYFVYNPTNRTLSTATLSTNDLTTRLTSVIQFDAYDNDTIIYLTDSTTTGKYAVRLTDGLEKNYLMRELPQNSQYLLAVSKLGSTVVAAVGATSENKVTVLRNPIGYLKSNQDKTIPLATTIFQLEQPQSIMFSPDASVVMARGSKRVATHYFEEDKTTRFEIPLAYTRGSVTWADNRHLMVTDDTNNAYILDFDGTNTQKLLPTKQAFGILFDSNFRYIYSFSNTEKPFTITRGNLLVEGD